MQIRDVNTPVTANFTQAELYTTVPNGPESHYLDDNVIIALQYIRDLSSNPIRVTSTYRTPAYNALIGGVSNSQHIQGRAIDFQWIDNNYEELVRFKSEFLKPNSELKQNLYDIGLRGLGFYETFLHIDTRPQEDWTTWGDDETMIAQDGYTAYVYDKTRAFTRDTILFWRDYKNYIAIAVLVSCIIIIIRLR